MVILRGNQTLHGYDTDTCHSDFRQSERGSRKDHPLRDLRQLSGDEERAHVGHRLRLPTLHRQMPLYVILYAPY